MCGLWPVWPLSRTCTLPLEDLPDCFQCPVCKHSARLFPQAVHSALNSWRKALWGGPLSGPWALRLWTSEGLQKLKPRLKNMHTSVPAPCTFRELS